MPRYISDEDRNQYSGKSLHDLTIENCVKIDYLAKDIADIKQQIKDHCEADTDTSRFNITTLVAIVALILGAVDGIIMAYPVLAGH